MAATNPSSRRALSNRSLQPPSLLSLKPSIRTSSASFKRPRSPDREDAHYVQQTKRIRGATTQVAVSTQKEAKKEKQAERDASKQEFKEKYTKAFPKWIFHFDVENINLKASTINILKCRVQQLDGQIEDFFSRNITHLITDRPIPVLDGAKENNPAPKAPYGLKSPIRLKARLFEEGNRNNDVVVKAVRYGGIKVWNASKLDSVLCRCLDALSVNAPPPPKPQPPPKQQLERLLTKEKLHGPSDRDPTQKRHDYRYFAKGSFFVLVEDMRGEVATIAAHEYPLIKERGDKGKAPWPILYCHPQSRGPFIPFDEKEKARWERTQQAKEKEEAATSERKDKFFQKAGRKVTQPRLLKGMGDLRRSVSLNNLHKRIVEESLENQELDADADAPGSANASGFLTGASYIAASGNSVGITSTTGTTSAASGSFLRNGQMPSAMDGLLKKEVITSRKFPSTKSLAEKRVGSMAPPSTIPSRPLLKKSKSTNTLKLPKRQEGSKPGYCESCRMKFDDFKAHVASTKHRCFARSDDNFVHLDTILDRVRRRTLHEVNSEEHKRIERCRTKCTRMAAGCLTDASSQDTP